MTTPQYPDPNQPQDPSSYQPPTSGGYQAPDPSACQPPSGAQQQPTVDPQAGGAYPPPGQPGAYPPPGQPGGAYPPGTPGMPLAPGEQPKKSNLPRIILAAAVVVIVVLGIVLYVVNRKSDPSTAAVGDCVKVNSVSTDDADVDKIDCTDPNAVYKVTATGANATCDENESTYYEEDKDGDTTTTLCLQPNVKAGDCFKIGDDTTPDAIVDCASTKGNEDVVKILKFDHSTSKESACPADADYALSFPTHTGVLCAKDNN